MEDEQAEHYRALFSEEFREKQTEMTKALLLLFMRTHLALAMKANKFPPFPFLESQLGLILSAYQKLGSLLGKSLFFWLMGLGWLRAKPEKSLEWLAERWREMLLGNK